MEPKIIKFPKKPFREIVEDDSLEVFDGEEEVPGRKRFFLAVVRALRFVLFIVLYWLRMPIVGLCSLVSVVTLLATGFVWVAFPEKSTMLWAFGVTSISSFFIAWLYDFVLMRLSPVPMIDSI